MINESNDPVTPEIASTEAAPASSTPFRPDLERLEAALLWLPAKCDDRTFAFYRIAPIAREARLNPELADVLYQLAKKWCGGGTYFERLWIHFVNQKDYTGPETTLGTVYRHAKEAGWTYQGTKADAE